MKPETPDDSPAATSAASTTEGARSGGPLRHLAVALGLRSVRSPNAQAGVSWELTNNDLAIARTYLAAERTLMGWIRTALSMIGLGFTVGKLAQAAEDGKVQGLLGFAEFSVKGLAHFLVLFGTVALLAAAIQHSRRVADLLRRGLPHRPSVAFAVALILGLVGVFAFAALVLEI